MLKQKTFLDQRAFSLSHVYVTFESQSWVNWWTTSASWAGVWSAWALIGLLTACLPPLLGGVLCLYKLQWIYPEHDSHNACFSLSKCDPVRRGHSHFSALTFCVTGHATKKPQPEQTLKFRPLRPDKGAGTARWNTEMRRLPFSPADPRFSTSQPTGSLAWLTASVLEMHKTRVQGYLRWMKTCPPYGSAQPVTS